MWIFDLDGKYFQRDSFINKKWQGLVIINFLRGGGGLVEDLRGKSWFKGEKIVVGNHENIKEPSGRIR